MSDRVAYYAHLQRIQDQTDRVLEAMRSGRWWTKQALAQAVRGSPHAMSARMSDLRKLGHRIEKRYEGGGLYLYRLVPVGHAHASADSGGSVA